MLNFTACETFKKVMDAGVLLVFIAIWLIPGMALATAEISGRTGLECSACHVNPLGGGELTELGRGFEDALMTEGKAKMPGTAERAARLLIGYLHILAAVVWFGAIFYVHILLRPAYASKGLPRGELMLGWTCIVVIAVTGTLLTISRMSSLAAFYDTRFGVLLSIKILFFVLMVTTAAVATFVIGPRLKKRMVASGKDTGNFTLDELHAFDGIGGNKAYVCVDGVVYDVSDSAPWKGGRHMRHLAGFDMSQAIRQAPHGPEKLETMPVVGRLSQDASKAAPQGAKKAFYIIAYLNLALVFLILGVVALWRWW